MVRFFRFEDVPRSTSPDGLRSDRMLISEESVGSKYLRCSLTEVKASRDGKVQPVTGYHYHTKRELFIIGLSGRTALLVEGKKYIVEPGTVLYVAPGEAHRTVDVGRYDGTVLEVWHDPPGEETVSVPVPEKAEEAPTGRKP
ncbi:MAG: cupin domain-containing protein [Candidatus Bathyarchaeia archaeon]